MSVDIENTANVLNLLRAECCLGYLEKLSDDTHHGGHVPLVSWQYHNATTDNCKHSQLTSHSSSSRPHEARALVISSTSALRSA